MFLPIPFRSSTSPKHTSLSPSSSSGHSSPRSPPTYPPPPPSSQPPPLPPGQNRIHTIHQNSPGTRMKSGKGSTRQSSAKQNYDNQHQYSQHGSYSNDSSYVGKGVANSKPHPQQYGHSNIPSSGYPAKGQANDKFYSNKQIPVSGLTSGHSAEVTTKIVASKQYAMPVVDHASKETGSDLSRVDHATSGDLSRGDHVTSCDPGIRECPSGASSPSSTPNNTLVKGSRVPLQYDPLTASSSDNQLLVGNRRQLSQSSSGEQLESRSDTNLLSYHSYPGSSANEALESQGGRVTKNSASRAVQKKPGIQGQDTGRAMGAGPTGQAQQNGSRTEGQGEREREKVRDSEVETSYIT